MTFPTVRPSRPAYPPPVPSGFTDPGGTTPVEHALRVQQRVHQQYSDWRAAHSRDIAPRCVARQRRGVPGVRRGAGAAARTRCCQGRLRRRQPERNRPAVRREGRR
jgi:hypothetical protein